MNNAFKLNSCTVLLCLALPQISIAKNVQLHRFMSARTQANETNVLRSDPDKHQEEDPEEEMTYTEHGQEMVTKVTKVVRWNKESNVSHQMSVLIACVWVLLLGSAPVLIYKMDERSVTKTGILISSAMWLALFGGVYLFTTTIEFSSSHFDHNRTLTTIECVYFMTQVITTVGYGDITPAHFRGQLFVGVYVTLSFFVIALLVSEMQAIVMSRVDKYKDLLAKKTGHDLSRGQSTVAFKPDKPSPVNLILSASFFCLVALVWVLFFHFVPGENKSWTEGIYMALITLTTVGFGAITPTTEAGMLFGAFMMFVGTAALVGVVTNFSEFLLQMTEWEAWNPKTFEDHLKILHLAEKKNNGLTENDFLEFTLLHKNLVTQTQLDEIKAAYHVHRGPHKSVSVKNIAMLSDVDPDQFSDVEEDDSVK